MSFVDVSCWEITDNSLRPFYEKFFVVKEFLRLEVFKTIFISILNLMLKSAFLVTGGNLVQAHTSFFQILTNVFGAFLFL